MNNSDKLLERYPWAIYLVVFLLGALLALVGANIVTSGPYNSLLLNIAASLIVVAAIFFLVDQFFQWRPLKQTEAVHQEEIKSIDSSLSELKSSVAAINATRQGDASNIHSSLEGLQRSIAAINLTGTIARMHKFRDIQVLEAYIPRATEMWILGSTTYNVLYTSRFAQISH